MRKLAVATALSLALLVAHGATAYPANASQKMQDTAVNRLYQTYQYQATSDLIAAKLAKGDVKTGSDLQLYYFNTLSMAQMRLNHLDSAKRCAYRSMKLASISTDSTLISEAWKVMSYAYNKGGQLDSALFLTNKLLNYSKRVGDQRQYRNALTSMGTILNQNSRPDEALKYYNEANLVTSAIGDTANFALSHYNLGLTFQKLKLYDSCFNHLEKAVLLAEIRNQSDLLFFVYGAMAESYFELENQIEWKKYTMKANLIAQQMGNMQYLAMGYNALARSALKEKDFAGAIKYGLKADSLLKKNPYQILQMNLDSMMFVSFSKLSRYEEALAWHLEFVKIKGKVIGEKQAAQLDKLMVEYGTREKTLTISNQNAEIRSKKIQLQLLALLLLLTLFFVALLFRYTIKIRRHRETLYQKEKYLDQQLAEMGQGSQFLSNANAGNRPADPSDDFTGESDEESYLRYPLYLQLHELLSSRKLYLDPELNLQTLITLLGTNKKYLYQAIAGYGEENFRSLINRYRVDESKRLIEQSIRIDSTQDMTTVYQAAGFNSAASFYRIFKQYTGLTPSEYANEARKELKKL